MRRRPVSAGASVEEIPVLRHGGRDRLTGEDRLHRSKLVVWVVAGGLALFLVWADLAARLLLPAQELPVGILTALCGVPFVLVLLRRSRYRFG